MYVFGDEFSTRVEYVYVFGDEFSMRVEYVYLVMSLA